jgi:hypothetical protein
MAEFVAFENAPMARYRQLWKSGEPRLVGLLRAHAQAEKDRNIRIYCLLEELIYLECRMERIRVQKTDG